MFIIFQPIRLEYLEFHYFFISYMLLIVRIHHIVCLMNLDIHVNRIFIIYVDHKKNDDDDNDDEPELLIGGMTVMGDINDNQQISFNDNIKIKKEQKVGKVKTMNSLKFIDNIVDDLDDSDDDVLNDDDDNDVLNNHERTLGE